MTSRLDKKKGSPQRAVIYIRYSSHNQDNTFTVEAQYEQCMRYIEQNGYKFVRQYVDEAKSGRKTAGRDAFNKMMYDAENDEFDRIIVLNFSRFARNTRDALNYITDLRDKCNVTVESTIERVNMDNAHGKFSATNLFAMHELQSDIIAGNVKAGMYYAAKDGYFLGGSVNYGYCLAGTGEFARGKERKKYAIAAEEAENVRDMFRLYADGFSLNYIQTEMALRGVKGRRSNDIISLQTIYRMMKNEFYIGTRTIEIDGFPPLHIENAVPPIIDRETWERVQARHAHNTPAPRERKKRLYPLTGKVFCTKCGAHMHGQTKGDKTGKTYSYYSCANKKGNKTCDMRNIRKDDLERYCTQQIRMHILDPEQMDIIADKIVEIAGSVPDNIVQRINTLQRRRKELARQIKELVKDKLACKISQDILDDVSADLNLEIAEIDIQLVQLEAAQRRAITKDDVILYLREMFENVDTVDPHVLKSIYDKLIDKVIVSDTHVELYLRVSPYPIVGDRQSQGQPEYKLSLNASRLQISPAMPGRGR